VPRLDIDSRDVHLLIRHNEEKCGIQGSWNPCVTLGIFAGDRWARSCIDSVQCRRKRGDLAGIAAGSRAGPVIYNSRTVYTSSTNDRHGFPENASSTVCARRNRLRPGPAGQSSTKQGDHYQMARQVRTSGHASGGKDCNLEIQAQSNPQNHTSQFQRSLALCLYLARQAARRFWT
jgi:hypothetical protein